MKKLMLLVVLITVVLISCKENSTTTSAGKVSGYVLNLKDNSPIQGALISTEPPSQMVLSDAAGKFIIDDLSPGDYVIKTTKNGFKPNSVTINVKNGKTTNAIIQLADNLTENRPPFKPSLPNPEHRGTTDKTPIVLSWSCSDPDGDQVKYDVFFDKNNPPTTKIGSDLTTTECDSPDLTDSTTYFWKVIAKDSYGAITDGDVWRFTVIKNSTTLPTGLIAYWSFDDETAKDQTGNGRNGTLMNNPTFVQGKKGKAISLVSQGDVGTEGSHVTIPTIPFSSYSEFSICLWVYEKSMVSSGGSYISFGDENLGKLSIDHELWRTDLNKVALQFSVGSAWNDIQSPNYFINPLLINFDTTNLNNWVHYTMTYAGGMIKAYKNGNLLGTLAQTVKVATTKAGIGIIRWNNGSAGGTRFTGYIDEVRIYNKELSANDIKNLIN